MVAGHLQEKKGYFYIVLSYPDVSGKRKTKWIPTSLPVKGNKKRAEKLLMEARREFEPECKPIQDDILFSDFMLQWLEIVKPTIAIQHIPRTPTWSKALSFHTSRNAALC